MAIRMSLWGLVMAAPMAHDGRAAAGRAGPVFGDQPSRAERHSAIIGAEGNLERQNIAGSATGAFVAPGGKSPEPP
jgi:hypothetical protein